VATAATAVVIACYVVAVFSLNLLVANRLTGQADARLAVRLAEATKQLPSISKATPSPGGDGDPDDAPIFLWSVGRSGSPTAITAGAPELPRRSWTGGAATVTIGGSPFRFSTVQSGSGYVIAGESLAQLQHVRDALLAPELLIGAALLIVVYAGSLMIGLRASAPLEIVQRRQAEFTADASHELRTPLSVIEAELEVSLSRPRSTEDYKAVLGRIAGEAHRLRHIVDDLLWLARADDEGPSAHQDQLTDIAAIAAGCTERFQPIANARSVDLGVTVEGKAPFWVRADAGWIDRLLGVLLDNACKYAGTGGRIEVQVRATSSHVLLQVDDSGPGIPADQRSMVFDRFHRGSEQPGGVGLGLAIADSVVRASEGTWSVGSAPSGGARMEVSWRRASGRRLDPNRNSVSSDAVPSPRSSRPYEPSPVALTVDESPEADAGDKSTGRIAD
jgi:signal transduction histidine kinase